MFSARGLAHGSVMIGGIATAALFRIEGLSVSCSVLTATLLASCTFSIVLSRGYTPRHMAMDRAVCCLENFSLLTLATVIGGLATYPLAAVSHGWLDNELLAGDAALGLNWLTYWDFVQRYPVLYDVLSFSYNSIFFTPTILVVALATSGKVDKSYRFIMAFITALFVTDLLLALIPGKSAAEHFLAITDPNLPTPGLMHIPIIERLRTGSFGPVEVEHLSGLIAFPSFHAAASVLFAWAAWSVQWLRLPGLILNVLMLASTPIQGGHYFVDTIAGILVAGLAIMLARCLPSTAALRSHDGTRPVHHVPTMEWLAEETAVPTLEIAAGQAARS